MAPLQVHIKHAGKVHDLTLNPDLPGLAFKEDIYQKTGVPVDRMKVMVKGGMLKDDSDWKKIGPKEGQTFMVIGAAGELPKPPEKPIVFLEDMDEEDLAQALALPVGLANLGNTCYMNSTVQAMRAIPELQVALNNAGHMQQPLARSLRDLYLNMSKTTSSVMPLAFLQILRQVVPQFAERSGGSKGGMNMAGFAQQDAEECWTQVTNALKDVPGLPTPSGSEPGNFVQQFMTGRMRRELKCDEAPDEPATVSTENVLKLECNINATTNYMASGIMDALDQKVEKQSPSLGRQAVYTQRSRLERLPQYLAVHMVRFTWKQDISAKAKILRKVKFPTEFDALSLTTDELRNHLAPANRRLMEIEKDRAERRKVRRRTKTTAETLQRANRERQGGDVEMADAQPGEPSGTTAEDTEERDAAQKVEELAISEVAAREKEKAELQKLVDIKLRDDVGASQTGLYDLVAIITHKGAAADSGHYMAFVKKSVFDEKEIQGASSSSGSAPETFPDSIDEDWYKFDDDKVSVFPAAKLTTLDGGGEDSSAYVLLYKSKPLA
ncbi:cysteine proteinase [Dentipellis sp. KUC8613]|nr:cysteine proteinase [Dentipellis sp. KUC8613]